MLPQKRGKVPSRIAMNCYWRVLAIFLLCLPRALSLQPAQPRVLLVSFDGFRWDYIYRVSTPNFHYAMENGVHVKQVTNVFITKTYPNHYTMVTGLYAESHGIVANEMYDPILNETFSMNRMDIYNSRFWEEASPIWVTNQREGHKTGAAMWPGTDVKIHGVFPTYYMPYNESVSFEDRVAKLIDWFTSEEPINFGLLYWEQPDEMGHILGPENPSMGPVISDVDQKLGYLMFELKKAKLWDAINVIITSDHGMSQSSSARLIELDQYVNREHYKVIDHSPVVAILPKEGKLDEVYEALHHAHPNMTVYKKEQIPERLHYKHNTKIQPILAVADKGWEIVRNKSDGFQQEVDNQIGFLTDQLKALGLWDTINIIITSDHGMASCSPKKLIILDKCIGRNNYTLIDRSPVAAVLPRQTGNHGYDNTIPEMHPIFLAVGPAFRKNVTKEAMNATDLYPLLCHLLGINALPNNGSFNAVKDLLAEEVPVAFGTDTYATVIGVFLGIFLVTVFIAVFVKHLILTQTNTMQMQHTEAARPLLQD